MDLYLAAYRTVRPQTAICVQGIGMTLHLVNSQGTVLRNRCVAVLLTLLSQTVRARTTEVAIMIIGSDKYGKTARGGKSYDIAAITRKFT